MTERISREELLSQMAALMAKRGTCGRAQVGCIITMDGRVIATGYNGPIKSEYHCDASICDLTKPCTRSVHAEANAIAHAAKYGIALDGSEMWCTHTPCNTCAELIIQAGIKKLHCMELYRDSPVELLNRNLELILL